MDILKLVAVGAVAAIGGDLIVVGAAKISPETVGSPGFAQNMVRYAGTGLMVVIGVRAFYR